MNELGFKPIGRDDGGQRKEQVAVDWLNILIDVHVSFVAHDSCKDFGEPC